MYLKSAGGFDAAEETERDTLICDENGFAQTKDMPYGIYTVHQTSGWDGLITSVCPFSFSYMQSS